MSARAAPVLKEIEDVAKGDVQVTISAKDENDTFEHLFLKNGLFEGDLKISEEFIRRFYNLSSLLGGEDSNLTGVNNGKIIL